MRIRLWGFSPGPILLLLPPPLKRSKGAAKIERPVVPQEMMDPHPAAPTLHLSMIGLSDTQSSSASLREFIGPMKSFHHHLGDAVGVGRTSMSQHRKRAGGGGDVCTPISEEGKGQWGCQTKGGPD